MSASSKYGTFSDCDQVTLGFVYICVRIVNYVNTMVYKLKFLFNYLQALLSREVMTWKLKEEMNRSTFMSQDKRMMEYFKRYE